MTHCGIQTPHYHGTQNNCPGNTPHIPDSKFFCYAPTPESVHNDDTDKDEPIARCRRIGEHAGPHQAYITGIRQLDEWPATVDLETN